MPRHEPRDHDAALAGPASVAATWCATLVDEWARCGLTDAVVAPGSRSTPLVLALAADGRLRVHVHHDERAAAFLALGLGRATRLPAPVVTTSGTAAVELHPAVVEAHHAAVPMILCTADRPPELHDVGAPQTVDQRGLFGRAVRWFADPGVPDAGSRHAWRSLAARTVVEATGRPPGPVHLNLAFREPLVGRPADLPPGRPDGAPWHQLPAGAGAAEGTEVPEPLRRRVDDLLATARGVIVAGGGVRDPAGVHLLADATGWPVLADPRSGCRTPRPGTVAAFDALLREPGFADRHRPEAVLRLGSPPASKALAQWLATSGAHQVVVDADGAWYDPERTAAAVVAAEPGALCRALAVRQRPDGPGSDGAVSSGGAGDRGGWRRAGASAEAAAQEALERVLAGHPEPTEPAVARAVAAGLPADATLVVASSMPVRDVEWYARPRLGLRVIANRGANGIDGAVSTAVGAALAGGPTAALVGDLAFLHDTNALLGLAERDVDLVIVVVDNRGGGIFHFLPHVEEVGGERFERYFATPHRADLRQLALAHGIGTMEAADAESVGVAVRAGAETGGLHVVLVSTDRAANVAVHDELHRAVAAAVGTPAR